MKTTTEVQLGFAFFTDAEASPATVSEGETRGKLRSGRAGSRSCSLADAIAAVQTALLEAPLGEVSAQLLPLFEFCEAALTRALDAVPTRPQVPFSTEEYRSLRGIGQAQWLLAEKQVRREEKPASSRARKTKKTVNDEFSSQ
jgi:hypothetical protein